MVEYQKYQHVCRLGTSETAGILDGTVCVFPKLDGTNCHVWFEDRKLRTGSRNKEIFIGNDNRGFAQYVEDNRVKFILLLSYVPGAHIFGEWLVPHTIKDYEESAWRQFYIFDIYVGGTYVEPATLESLCERCGLNYIPMIAAINNPTEQQLVALTDENKFLMKEGCVGEGVVIKNYLYKNKYGRRTWAKIVRNEFKQKRVSNIQEKGAGAVAIEYTIVSKCLSDFMIEKVYAKIVNENDGEWEDKFIPRLLSEVWHDFINEELWDALKKYRNPTINFRDLNKLVVGRVKQVKSEVF